MHHPKYIMVFYLYTKNYKKRLNGSQDIANRPFWARFAQFGPNMIFFSSKKSLHHLKHVMVFYLYAKNYKKRSNGSKDIAIRRIERCDWSRGKMLISRELEFYQTCGFRRMIEKHNSFHFRPLLAKTNDSILQKSPKTLILGTFGLIWAKREFSQKIGLCHFFAFMDP